MNLRELVLSKVDELGDQAPEYFGKTKMTIMSWKRPNAAIPMAAAQKILDECDQITDIPEVSPDQANTDEQLQQAWAFVDTLRQRIEAIEVFLAQVYPAQNAQPQNRQPIVFDQSEISALPQTPRPDQVPKPMARNVPPRTGPTQNITQLVGPQPHPSPQVQPPTIPNGAGSWLQPGRK